ncbi:hypothetical protein TNCV_2653401 [Trichonephila clavipes]|nr:hypothetical protein TNCV_2653401 [Trichonephila clavipes]
MNGTTQQEKTTQLSSRNEQLNSAAGTKQLNSTGENNSTRQVNIDGLCCSGKFLSPGSGSEGKREIVLNRRPELYRGKYRCVQPKINLLKRRSYACETMFSCGTFRMSKRCLHMMEKLSSSEKL